MSADFNPLRSLLAAQQSLDARVKDLESQAVSWRMSADRLRAAMAGNVGASCLLAAVAGPNDAAEDFRVVQVDGDIEAVVGSGAKKVTGWTTAHQPDAMAWPKLDDLLALHAARGVREESLRLTRRGKPFTCVRVIGAVPDGLVIVWRDVTQQDPAHPARVDPEDWFRRSIESLPCMVVALDKTRMILVWNHRCEQVSGYRADEIVGNEHAMRLLYPEKAYRKRMLEEWKTRGKEYDAWEWTLRTKDGRDVPVAWYSNHGRYPISGWNSWAVGMELGGGHPAGSLLPGAGGADVYRTSLQGLPTALLVVDAELSLLYANSRAEAMLRAPGGLRNRGGHLVSDAREPLEKLRHLVERVCAGVDLPSSQRIVSLPQPAGRPLIAVVRPSAAPPGAARTAAIFVDDPNTPLPESQGILESLFGLTAKEARVAVQIAEGLGPGEVAQRTGTSVKTVRTQLEAIFQKLDVRRQSQLVGIVQRVLLVAQMQAT